MTMVGIPLVDGARLGQSSSLLEKTECHCPLEKERGLATTLFLTPF
jgi:hypothetical protein